MGQIMTMFYKQEIDLVDQPPPTQELIVRSATRAFRGVYYVIGTKKANEKKTWCNLVVLVVLIFLSGFTLHPHTPLPSLTLPLTKKSEK